MHEKRTMNRRKEPPWTAPPCPGNGADGGRSVGALVLEAMRRDAGRGLFPESTCGRGRGRSCRSARPTFPGPRRRQGAGAGAARSCAGQRPGPCGFARGAGVGRMGVGNERHAFANAKDLAPATSCISCRGNASGDLGKPLSPDLRRRQVGSCVVALPRLCIRPPGHFVVTGLPGRRARCITFFAASLSIFSATPARLCRRV